MCLVYRHFPLPTHPFAELAANRPRPPARQGKFWQMHDALFANQQAISDAGSGGAGGDIDLDMKRFEREMLAPASPAARAGCRGRRPARGRGGTPTFFINGERYLAIRTMSLASGIEKALVAPGAEAPGRRWPSSGARPRVYMRAQATAHAFISCLRAVRRAPAPTPRGAATAVAGATTGALWADLHGRPGCAISGAFTAIQPAAGSSGTSSNATMLMILMSGLTAGPAVSL